MTRLMYAGAMWTVAVAGVAVPASLMSLMLRAAATAMI